MMKCFQKWLDIYYRERNLEIKKKKWKRQANSRRPFSYQENLQRGNTEMVWAHVEIIKAFQDTPAINYKSWEKERLQTNEVIEG